MRPPDLGPGQIEQAIFTWSTRNPVTGVMGQSFGAVSAGLKGRGAWLQAIDTSVLQARGNSLGNWSQAYPEWRQFNATCTTTLLGGLVAVYRKIADAGTDPNGRVRSLAHCLIGAQDSLHLASVDPGDTHWLTAEDCPLDNLPKLQSLRSADLRPRRVGAGGHTCEYDDDASRQYLKLLIDGRGTMTLDGELALVGRFVEDALLTALPVDLWRAIRNDWFVTEQGPVCHVSVAPEMGRRSGVAEQRQSLAAAGLSGCSLHEQVERAWASSSGKDAWLTLSAIGRKTPPERPTAKVLASAPASASSNIAVDSPRRLVEELVSRSTGATTWTVSDDESYDLTDAQLRQVVPLLAKTPSSTRAWLGSLTVRELWKLFSGAKSHLVCNRTDAMLERIDFPTDELHGIWRRSGIALFGFAVTKRVHDDPKVLNVAAWAGTRIVDREEIGKLLKWVVASDSAFGHVATLLKGGLIAAPELRSIVIPSLVEAGCRYPVFFRTVLPSADLGSNTLVEVIRELPTEFADAFSIPDCYVDALRRALPPRRSRRLSSLRSRPSAPPTRHIGPADASTCSDSTNGSIGTSIENSYDESVSEAEQASDAGSR